MKLCNLHFNLGFCFSMGTIVISMALLLYFAYMILYPFEPAEFMNAPFPVKEKVITAGDRISYYVEYHKLMNVPARANTTLVNHVQINFSEVNSFLSKGDYEVINHDITIPEFVTPGTYHLVITWTYRINPIREIVMTSRTEDFEIVAK